MTETEKKSPLWMRLAPVVLIVTGLVVALQMGVLDLLSFDQLYQQRTALQEWVTRNGIMAGFAFGGLYAVLVAFSLPAGAALTVISGFLFGPTLATLIVVTGATVGATGVFLAARTALGEALRAKAGPFINKMQAGFEENAMSYMLVLRLIPAFPFWLVNIVPAFMGVKTTTYMWTTFVGIIPGTFVFTLFGGGLDSVFKACDVNRETDPNAVCNLPPASEILTIEIMAALGALALLSLMPIVYRKIKGQPAQTPADS